MHRIHWAGASTAGLILALPLALPATPAVAQQQQVAIAPPPATASAPPIAPASSAPTLGPTYMAAQFGFHQDAATPTELNRDAFKTSRREGRVLAIVGGAALIAGLLIGDDAGTLIAIGGAGLGLYGLYVWQR